MNIQPKYDVAVHLLSNVLVIAETPSGEYITIATEEEPQQAMQFTDTVSTERCDVIDDEIGASTPYIK